jgi:hypothetical protein
VHLRSIRVGAFVAFAAAPLQCCTWGRLRFAPAPMERNLAAILDFVLAATVFSTLLYHFFHERRVWCDGSGLPLPIHWDLGHRWPSSLSSSDTLLYSGAPEAPCFNAYPG